MRTLITLLLALVAGVWGWDLAQTAAPAGAHPLWLARLHLLNLSGFLSLALMSLAMLLATRPTWLEGPLGGMDRIYRTHKWAGILAVGFAALHWLIEMSSDVLKATIGRAGRPPKESFTGWLDVLRDLAEEMGEWAIYAVLAMLIITLWKRFPYRVWRWLHKAMPVLYLMLAFHAVMLAPRAYWSEPAGALLAVLLVAGVYGAIHSLAGFIGRRRATLGRIVAIEHPSPDITTVRCEMAPGWGSHRAGQFAFVTFDAREGAHPFTIASAPRDDRTLTFQIKALGDYTGQLAQQLHVGQPVRVEGPYGRFQLDRHNPAAEQIWIAAGIGVTPFLAWLESLQGQSAPTAPIVLHYCTRDQRRDAMVARLQALCATLPAVQLHIHDAHQGDRLQAQALQGAKRAEIWYCGPHGLAASLREGLRALGLRYRFHQEAFDMR